LASKIRTVFSFCQAIHLVPLKMDGFFTVSGDDSRKSR
jgi:hypothetical protein